MLDNREHEIFKDIFMFFVGFSIATIIVIIVFFITQSNTIKPHNCNAPLGSFSVDAGYTAISTEPIKSVTGLEEASNICLLEPDCKSFIYDEKAKTMQKVSLTSEKIKSNNKNLYTLQTGVTYN